MAKGSGHPDGMKPSSLMELGSDAHRALVGAADANVAEVVAAVELMRERGGEVLLVVCSDHGHETIDRVIPVPVTP